MGLIWGNTKKIVGLFGEMAKAEVKMKLEESPQNLKKLKEGIENQARNLRKRMNEHQEYAERLNDNALFNEAYHAYSPLRKIACLQEMKRRVSEEPGMHPELEELIRHR